MKLKAIEARDIPPVNWFAVDNLSNVVVIAGPNGVGKTRLIGAFLQALRTPQQNPTIRFSVEATSASERAAWGKAILDTALPPDRQAFQKTLQQSHRRTNWESSVIQIESDRSIQQIQPFSFSWDIIDPWEEMLGWEYSFNYLKNRFQDTVHSLFRKVQSRRDEISRKAELLIKQGEKSMALDFPDPLLSFKAAFSQLLAPKELLDPEAKQQQLYYRYEGQQFPLQSLSSGEREVVNIVFDFLLRNPSHCIVIFDEPELHLHPELSYKLLQTLHNHAENNQFIYCTHSPDIITASLEHSVVFIAQPTKPPSNQAMVVKEDDQTNLALKKIGQSIGIVALGKKIVLIEGENSSLDKQVFGSILKNRFPDIVMVPSGGKERITSFASIMTGVLERSMWGVNFFMLCDRDAAPLPEIAKRLEKESNGGLRFLDRYHLENYFINEHVLARVFSLMEPTHSWLRNPDEIRRKLRELANEMISYATALIESAKFRNLVGNIDMMPKMCHRKGQDEIAVLMASKAKEEQKRILELLDEQSIMKSSIHTFDALQRSIASDTNDWLVEIPGRPLFNRFAALTGVDPGRLKTLYLHEANNYEPYPFTDILNIFGSFAEM